MGYKYVISGLSVNFQNDSPQSLYITDTKLIYIIASLFDGSACWSTKLATTWNLYILISDGIRNIWYTNTTLASKSYIDPFRFECCKRFKKEAQWNDARFSGTRMRTEVKGGYFRHSFINKTLLNYCSFNIVSYLFNNNDDSNNNNNLLI